MGRGGGASEMGGPLFFFFRVARAECSAHLARARGRAPRGVPPSIRSHACRSQGGAPGLAAQVAGRERTAPGAPGPPLPRGPPFRRRRFSSMASRSPAGAPTPGGQRHHHLPPTHPPTHPPLSSLFLSLPGQGRRRRPRPALQGGQPAGPGPPGQGLAPGRPVGGLGLPAGARARVDGRVDALRPVGHPESAAGGGREGGAPGVPVPESAGERHGSGTEMGDKGARGRRDGPLPARARVRLSPLSLIPLHPFSLLSLPFSPSTTPTRTRTPPPPSTLPSTSPRRTRP